MKESRKALREGLEEEREGINVIILYSLKNVKNNINRVFGYKNSFPSNNIVEEW